MTIPKNFWPVDSFILPPSIKNKLYLEISTQPETHTKIIDVGLVRFCLIFIITSFENSRNIDFATIGLGEVFEAPPTVTLPNTAYNGNNVIMSTGSKRFSGGVYMLSIPTFCVAVSSPNYQATLSYRIDNGSWNNIIDWAYWETGVLIGSIGATIPINISSGNHTIDIGIGTNSSGKTITVGSAQNIRSFLTKVGV